MNQYITKIIHLIGSLNPGGVQTYILNVSKYDKIYNINREVWTLYQEGGLLDNEFHKMNIKTASCQIIPPDKNRKPYFLWKRLRKFAGAFYFFRFFIKLKKTNPSLVVIDEPARILTQFIVARLLNIPIVWNIHSEKSLVKNKLIFKWIYKYFLKKSLTIISDSNYILLENFSYMEKFFSSNFENIPVVHATVDLDKFLFINKRYTNKKDFMIIGSVGRLNWAKGYDLLIKSLKIVKKNYPNFQMKIAGDGPYRDKLEHLIDKYSLRNNVSILGELHYTEIPDFYNSIDLYVQPSTSEGSPITLKEAMASSLPILASNAGGIPEIIKHNQTGILFESGNRQELEKGLIKIIAMDDSQKKEMGEKARASSIKQFNIKKTSNTLYNIYNSILDSDQTK